MPTLTTEELYETLLEHMGQQHWWPAENGRNDARCYISPKYELEKCRHGFTSVKRKTNFNPQKFLSLPLTELQETIRSAAFIGIKESHSCFVSVVKSI